MVVSVPPFVNVRAIALMLTVVALVAASCADDDPSDEPSAAATTADAGTEATDTTGVDAASSPATESAATPWSIELAHVERSVLAAEVTVSSLRPARVRLSARSGDHVVETPPTAAVSTQHVLPLVGLRAERDYDVVAAFEDEAGALVGEVTATFTTGALPAWFSPFDLEFDAERTAPGYTIVEVDDGTPSPDAPSSQYLMALDGDGEIVWYYFNTGVVGAVEQTAEGTFVSHYWPFGAREIDVLGRTVGNWAFTPDEPVDGTVDPGAQDAAIDPELIDYVQDESRGLTDEVTPIPLWADWVRLGGFHHEVWPMANGNLLTMSTTVHELTPEQRAAFCPDDPNPFDAISDVIVEFERSGRVVRTWDLWDAIDIDETPGRELCIDAGLFAEASVRDWTHANAAVYDPERDAVIVSSRHTNQIVAFDHLDAEGPQTSVRWILGEDGTIPLTSGEPPLYQHAVEVQPDGSILLYDNGNHRPGTAPGDPVAPTYSRAVRYVVDDSSADPAEWSAAQVWEHRTTEDDGTVAYAAFIGDADRLANGNVLITHGGLGTFDADDDDPLRALIIEVVPDGESGGDVVWKLELGTPDDPHAVYRSERIESFYVGPLWQPAAS